MKLLLAGGGTGGHLFSGLAVAEDYLSRGEAVTRPSPVGARHRRAPTKDDVLFVGTSYGLENTLIPQLGYRLELIPVKQLKGKGILHRLKTLAQIPYAFWKSFQLLRRERPDLVLGIGGYASGPVTLMARFLGVKTAIIEQNSFPGFTNRVLGKFVHRVFIAFENARKFFSAKKTFLTGNPVRKSFFNVVEMGRGDTAWSPAGVGPPPSKILSGRRGAAPTFTILILGGSQGAHSVNVAMAEAVSHLVGARCTVPLRVIHQTGKVDAEMVRAAYDKTGVEAQVFEFIQDVQNYYAQADLVICRSGAGTITELEIMGKPSILIPYPFAADDHQRINALELVEAGAARMILSKELNGERLAQEIEGLRNDPKLLSSMGEQARHLAKPMAAHDILKICGEML